MNQVENVLPCPFCGSDNVRLDNVLIAHDYGEDEVDVIECLACDAQAPIQWWNRRVEHV